jgi:hypothetical protein
MQKKEFLGIKPNFNDKMGFTMDLSVEKYEKDEETGKIIKSQFKKSAGSFIEKSETKEKTVDTFNKKEGSEEKPNESRFNFLYNGSSKKTSTGDTEATLIFKDPKDF